MSQSGTKNADPESQPLMANNANAAYQQQPQTAYVVQQDKTPIGMILFILGFCFGITWYVGICFPKPVTKKDLFWRKMNILFSILTLIPFIVVIILMVTGSAFVYHNAPNGSGGRPNGSGGRPIGPM
jgi:ABC-type methionine transport system permease subunit